MLSTCNRSEIYVASSDPAQSREELVAFLSDYHHVPAPVFQPHLFALENSAAGAHLVRVAAVGCGYWGPPVRVFARADDGTSGRPMDPDHRHPLRGLLLVQFLGAFNDGAFKLLRANARSAVIRSGTRTLAAPTRAGK